MIWMLRLSRQLLQVLFKVGLRVFRSLLQKWQRQQGMRKLMQAWQARMQTLMKRNQTMKMHMRKYQMKLRAKTVRVFWKSQSRVHTIEVRNEMRQPGKLDLVSFREKWSVFLFSTQQSERDAARMTQSSLLHLFEHTYILVLLLGMTCFDLFSRTILYCPATRPICQAVVAAIVAEPEMEPETRAIRARSGHWAGTRGTSVRACLQCLQILESKLVHIIITITCNLQMQRKYQGDKIAWIT